MSDDSQIHVPPSFVQLFIPEGRLKPTASAKEIGERYEICEDLATSLVDRARTVLWQLGVAEQDVLERIHRGLQDPQAGLTGAEAVWVVRRLAELLEWEDFRGG